MDHGAWAIFLGYMRAPKFTPISHRRRSRYLSVSMKRAMARSVCGRASARLVKKRRSRKSCASGAELDCGGKRKPTSSAESRPASLPTCSTLLANVCTSTPKQQCWATALTRGTCRRGIHMILSALHMVPCRTSRAEPGLHSASDTGGSVAFGKHWQPHCSQPWSHSTLHKLGVGLSDRHLHQQVVPRVEHVVEPPARLPLVRREQPVPHYE